jgi:hypothetical protein
MKNTSHRILLYVSVALGCMAAVIEAQTKPIPTISEVTNSSDSYAVVSIIGDKVNIVLSQMQTGTNLDPNRKAQVNLPDQGLDGQIMLIVDNAIKKQCPVCKTSLLKATPVETPEEGEKLLPALLGAAQQAKVNHLVVLTKYKDEARLKFDGTSLGQGKLTGLGFFIDKTTRIKNVKTLETGTGYLGPYAYFKLHVINVATGDVIYSQGLTTSTRIAVTQPGNFDPWNAIPAERKIPMLLGLVRNEVERVLDLRKLGLAQ